MKAEFTKALKMNENDYMKEFKDKAAKVTKELNTINHGDGSSAIYNLNMHQDFIINKLGLKKKMSGHDLVIKILLYKIWGLKANEEKANKDIKKPKSVMSTRFAQTRQNRSALQNYIRNNSRGQRKSGTHQGSRFTNNLFKGNILEIPFKNAKGQMNNISNMKSVDMASGRKYNKDSFALDHTIQETSEKQSPKSTINNIIDQWYMAGEDGFMSIDQDYSNVDSMFELNQNLAEKYKPHFKTEENLSGVMDFDRKWAMRPTTMASKKRVTFKMDENDDESPAKLNENDSILSLSESYLSDNNEKVETDANIF